METNNGMAVNSQGFLELKPDMKIYECENHRVGKTLVFPYKSDVFLATDRTMQRKPAGRKTLPHIYNLSMYGILNDLKI